MLGNNGIMKNSGKKKAPRFFSSWVKTTSSSTSSCKLRCGLGLRKIRSHSRRVETFN